MCNIIIIIQDVSVLILQGSQAYACALHRAGFLTEEEEQAIPEGLTLVNILLHTCFFCLCQFISI